MPQVYGTILILDALVFMYNKSGKPPRALRNLSFESGR